MSPVIGGMVWFVVITSLPLSGQMAVMTNPTLTEGAAK